VHGVHSGSGVGGELESVGAAANNPATVEAIGGPLVAIGAVLEQGVPAVVVGNIGLEFAKAGEAQAGAKVIGVEAQEAVGCQPFLVASLDNIAPLDGGSGDAGGGGHEVFVLLTS
jgi:hypothetical protein